MFCVGLLSATLRVLRAPGRGLQSGRPYFRFLNSFPMQTRPLHLDLRAGGIAMRVAVYGRVSTKEQHAENQIDELTSYAAVRNLEVVEVYIDNGVSGSAQRRPAIDQMIADGRRRRFDAILVWKLDRLARSVRHLTTLAGELEALGIDLIVLDQAIDTSTPTGRLLFHVLGAIAEFEGDLIRDRIAMGMRAARRNGTRIGRPKTVTGELQRRIVRLRESGRTIREIAGLVGVSKASVGRVVSKPKAANVAS